MASPEATGGENSNADAFCVEGRCSVRARYLLCVMACLASAPDCARADAAAGPAGAALRFGSKNTFVTLRVHPPTTAEMTWAAWIKFEPRSAALPQGIFTKPETGVAFVREKDGGFRLDVGNRSYPLPGPLGGVPCGDWQHVALVLTPTSASLFVNGATVGAAALNTTVWSDKVQSETLLIGAGSDSNPRPLDGVVDDVRLYGRALCSEQILSMRWTPPRIEDRPIGYWDFDEGSGQVVRSKAPVGPAYEGYLGSGATPESSDPQWTSPGPFSDTTITFDSPEEYLRRVGNNNYTDPGQPYDRVHVRRVANDPLDPLGFLSMSNVRLNAGVPDDFQVERGRCKIFFGAITASWVTCRLTFGYHFTSRDEVLAVYLSNSGELVPHTAKNQASWARGPSVVPPAPGQPGAPGSNEWAGYDFTWNLSTERLDFSKGIYVDFEVRGPARMSVQVNDCSLTVLPGSGLAPPWPEGAPGGCPGMFCILCCADIAGTDHCVNGPEDTIATFLHCGLGLQSVPGYARNGRPADANYCKTSQLDGRFSKDGRVTVEDAICTQVGLGLSCGSGLLTLGMTDSPDLTLSASPDPCGAGILKGDLIVAGKRARHITRSPENSSDTWNLLTDALYGFTMENSADPNDPVCTLCDGPRTLGWPKPCTRLIRDAGGALYQINLEAGLIRVTDAKPVIPRRRVSAARYGGADVYVGTLLSDVFGSPIQDVAFNSAGSVYVVPVLVVPPGVPGSRYYGVAKLTLAPNPTDQDPPYMVDWIARLADPGPNSSCTRYEVEVATQQDGNDHVFVFDAGDSYLIRNPRVLFWQLDPSGSSASPASWTLDDPNTPTTFYLSPPPDETLYLGMTVSSIPDWPYSSYVLQAPLAVFDPASKTKPTKTVRLPFCTVTSITEDPTTATLWLAGFALGKSREESVNAAPTAADIRSRAELSFSPLYRACVTRVPRYYPAPGPPPAWTCLSDYGADQEGDAIDVLSLPLSIIWTGNGG